MNFTTAKMTTTITVSTPAEKLMIIRRRQPGVRCLLW